MMLRQTALTLAFLTLAICMAVPAKPALAIDYATGSGGRFSNEIDENYVESVRRMTREFVMVMKHQMAVLGTFFDADIQLDTQMLYQRLNAEANKDYQPGELMCQYGTFIRSVAMAEEKTKTDRDILNDLMMGTYTNQKNLVPEKGADADMVSRIHAFKTIYCNPADEIAGLTEMCKHPGDANKVGGQDPNRFNKDVNYASTLQTPLTLDMNYEDAEQTADEKDVYYLARNLYWARAMDYLDDENAFLYNPSDYAEARRLMAMQSVAHNSFTNIVALKSRTDPGIAEKSGWNHMKALMKDFGLSEQEINASIGDFPSYYAQMDILSKKMYQSPDFYTNLYDKPANVARIQASMEAISLMQQRDHYKSALRRQMNNAVLLEKAIAQKAKQIATGF